MASIVAADLVPYNSANDLTNGGIDAATIGGAIDASPPAGVHADDGQLDARGGRGGATTTNVTVRGRNAAGRS
jgi:hypothetical protein